MKPYSIPIAIAVAVGFLGMVAAHQFSPKATALSEPPLPSPDEIKVKARPMEYQELAREPGRYAGTLVLLEGKVVQAVLNGDDWMLRVNVTRDKYEFWKDTVWVDYRRRGPKRILEGDLLRIWGRYTGIRSYTTVMKATVQIPRVHAVALELLPAAQARAN
jgi:hypothetical protein